MRDQEHWLETGGIPTRMFGDIADPDIVLLNGGMADGHVCANALVWERNWPRLNAAFRPCAIELPGHGRTALARRNTSIDVAAQVAHLAACLDGMTQRQRHLVGHDAGALATLSLAFQRPDLVASLTLISPAALVPSGDGVPNLALSGRLYPPMSQRGQAWVLEHQSFERTHVAQGGFLTEAAAIAEELGPIEETPASLPSSRSLVTAQRREKAETYVRLREAGIAQPVMLVLGAQDRLVPLANAHALFSQIRLHSPRACFHVINNAGFYPFREQPPAFESALAGFVGAAGPVGA